jgi:uncharacterized protein
LRVFLDTNVLISAFTARGLCADLVEIVLKNHHLQTGEIVLSEFDRVLTTKLKVPRSFTDQTIEFLRRFYVEPLPENTSETFVRDEDDRWVLESAIRARADVLVTGDRDLLDISDQVMAPKIITPRQFIEKYH